MSCTASDNGFTGILVSGMAIGNTASGNGGIGINLVGGAAINNAVVINRDSGILGAGTISGNYVAASGSAGISVNCPSAVVSNTAAFNTGGDIVTSGSGCTRANNAPAP